MTETSAGRLAMAAAAMGDVAAWCLLALVVPVVRAEALDGAVVTTVLAGVFILVMAAMVRPFLRFVIWQQPKGFTVGQGSLAAALLVMLVACLATEFIGIHALFGAFAAGAVMPRDRGVAKALIAKLEDLVVVLFLPLFFALSGLRTQIGLVSGAQAWLQCGLLLALAMAGKLGGVSIAARLAGQTWNEAMKLGVMMNTRGLMELVVLNIGLDLGVISPALFTMLVLMALVTTAATTPLLAWFERRRARLSPAAAAPS